MESLRAKSENRFASVAIITEQPVAIGPDDLSILIGL
jgi:hypothetical protein